MENIPGHFQPIDHKVRRSLLDQVNLFHPNIIRPFEVLSQQHIRQPLWLFGFLSWDFSAVIGKHRKLYQKARGTDLSLIRR